MNLCLHFYRENPRASRGGERSLSNRHQNPFHDDMAMMPFGGFFGGGVFGQLNNMMRHMEHRALSDPNAHIYSQSTVSLFFFLINLFVFNFFDKDLLNFFLKNQFVFFKTFLA